MRKSWRLVSKLRPVEVYAADCFKSFCLLSVLQTFDTGRLETSGGAVDISNVQTFAGFVLHIGRVEQGRVAVGDAVTVKVRRTRDSA